MPPLRISVVVLATALAGCAHRAPRPSSAMLREGAENFHKYLRWGDPRAAARFVEPDQRLRFLEKALEVTKDEQLQITDYEIQDAQVRPSRATVLSTMTWYRLPSLSTHTETMVLEWVERDGGWWIASIRGGPVPLDEKGGAGARAPASPPAALPGAEAPSTP